MTTTTAIQLRDYQQEAIEALRQAYAEGIRAPAVVLPTGAGKTVIFSSMAATARQRMLILAHRDELISQAADKVRSIAPNVDLGIVKAERNESDRRVVVASVQSLINPVRREALGDIGIIVCDEAHHATAKTYRKIFDHFPDAFRIGFSATLARTDGAALGEVWDDVVYTRSIQDMIEDGYLVKPRGIHVSVADLHLENVKVRGDFTERDLGRELIRALAPELAAKAYVEHASDRSGLLFTPTVEAAYAFGDALNDQGVKTEVVHGAMPVDERRGILARLESGETQVVSNCMVLTEGFDCPRVSCVVIARPTKSAPLYTQIVGRVLRPFPGKVDALVLDITGVSSKVKLATLADLLGAEKREQADPVEQLEEEPTERERIDIDYATGDELLAREVDLFAESTSAWAKTAAGTWFLPAGDKNYVFLRQQPDATWKVWQLSKAEGFADHGGDLGLRAAKRLGEKVARRHGALSSKGWRESPQRASGGQLSFLDKLRIKYDPLTVTKGEASSLIDARLATQTIDRAVASFGL